MIPTLYQNSLSIFLSKFFFFPLHLTHVCYFNKNFFFLLKNFKNLFIFKKKIWFKANFKLIFYFDMLSLSSFSLISLRAPLYSIYKKKIFNINIKCSVAQICNNNYNKINKFLCRNFRNTKFLSFYFFYYKSKYSFCFYFFSLFYLFFFYSFFSSFFYLKTTKIINTFGNLHLNISDRHLCNLIHFNYFLI